MKLSKGRIERTGDRTKILGQFKDRMRRIANVKITMSFGPSVEEDEVICEGPSDEVIPMLFSLASIAWAVGWRPRGLIAAEARLIETFKELPIGETPAK